jgi:hypothetical protein
MFFLAEQALVAEPVDLAFAYLKHGLFLQDLGDAPAQQAALDYLVAGARSGPDDAAARRRAAPRGRVRGAAQPRQRARAARPAGRRRGRAGARGRRSRGGARGRRWCAATSRRAAAICPPPSACSPRSTSARRSSTTAARSRSSSRTRIAAAAIWSPPSAPLRTAIDATEALRATGDAELRPWVLAHRVEPYVALIAQYATQGRGLDALVVAESLHARTWLDVVVAQGSAPLATAEQSLVAARLRQRPRRVAGARRRDALGPAG